MRSGWGDQGGKEGNNADTYAQDEEDEVDATVGVCGGDGRVRKVVGLRGGGKGEYATPVFLRTCPRSSLS